MVGRLKKNVRSVGAGVSVSGQAFFQTFLEEFFVKRMGSHLTGPPWASSVRRLFLDPFVW